MLCVAGVDEFNNDNIDEGGNQVAFDSGNSANQINAAGRRLLTTFGSQSNGESFCPTSTWQQSCFELHNGATPLPVYASPTIKLLVMQMNHLNKHMNADGVIAWWSMSHVYSCTSNLIWHSFANRLNVQEPLPDCQLPQLNLPMARNGLKLKGMLQVIGSNDCWALSMHSFTII